MPKLSQPSKASPVLQAIREEVSRQGSNPYRLAKLTGLRISTMQRFLAGDGSPTLSTIEAVVEALGLELAVRMKRK
jgi:DNA-binding phage protein